MPHTSVLRPLPTIARAALLLALSTMAVSTLQAQSSSGANVLRLWKARQPAPTRAVDTTAQRRPATAARPVSAPIAAPNIDSASAVPATDAVVRAPAAVPTPLAPVAALLSRADAESLANDLVARATESLAEAFAAELDRVNQELDSLRATQERVSETSGAAAKAASQALAGIGNFRFSGDLRVRYEGQFQGGGFATRHRERSRLRLTLSGNVSEQLSGVFSIASGALQDHQSTNQTQTGVFNRKTVGLDRFYLQWKPRTATGFGVVAGKFPYPWERSSLTFGNDINPEGVAPSFTWARSGALSRVAVVGFLLPYWEVSGGQDSYAVGGQLQTRWKFSDRWSARASFATVAFEGEDAIAVAAAAGSIKPSTSISNAIRKDSAGTVLGYGAQFHIDDALLQLEYIRSAKWPVSLQLNAARNRHAAPGDALGLRSELRIGRLSKPRDLQVSWSAWRIEREAVISALNEQDLRAGTNVLSHRIGASFQFIPSAALNLGLWRGRLLDPSRNSSMVPAGARTNCTAGATASCRDPWLNRLQLDIAYRF